MTALQSSETWPPVPVAVNPDGAERVVVVVVIVVVVSVDSSFLAQEIVGSIPYIREQYTYVYQMSSLLSYCWCNVLGECG